MLAMSKVKDDSAISHTIQSTNLITEGASFGRHQLQRSAVRIHTDTSLEFSQNCSINLSNRDVVIDSYVFATLMDSRNPYLCFSDTFCVKVLASENRSIPCPSCVVDKITRLDIRDARSITVLPESLVDYAVGKDMPTPSIVSDKLPFGIQVLKTLDLDALHTEVAMRSAVLQAICGSTKATTRAHVFQKAAGYNDELRLFNYSWTKSAITISGDTSFLAKYYHALQAAGFARLEYISVTYGSNSDAILPPKKLGGEHSLSFTQELPQKKVSKIKVALQRSFTMRSSKSNTASGRRVDVVPFKLCPSNSQTSDRLVDDLCDVSSTSYGTSTVCYSPSKESFSLPAIPAEKLDFNIPPAQSQLRKAQEQWNLKALEPLVITKANDSNLVLSAFPTPPSTHEATSTIPSLAKKAQPLNSLRLPTPVGTPAWQNNLATPETSSVYSKPRSSPQSPTTSSPILSELNYYLLGNSSNNSRSSLQMARNSTGKKQASYSPADTACRQRSKSSASTTQVSMYSVDSGKDELTQIKTGTVAAFQPSVTKSRTRKTVDSVMLTDACRVIESDGINVSQAPRELGRSRSRVNRSPSFQYDLDGQSS